MSGLENQIEGRHGFDGEFMPNKDSKFFPGATFSVSIFQWIPKASGKGLKKGKVVYRVRGRVGDAEKVYARAREVCRHFDRYAKSADTPRWEGPTKKSETVK